MTRRLLTALPAAALALALTACGGSDDDTSATSTAPAAAGDATTSSPATTGTDSTDVPEETTGQSPESPAQETPTMPGNPDVPIIPGTPDAYTGSWRDPDGGAVVTFADDGTLTGTDGCNNFRSTWTLDSGNGGDGSTATVAPFPTTMMACSGPWSPWVLSMQTVNHAGDHLSVTNEGGVEIGRLIPAVPA